MPSTCCTPIPILPGVCPSLPLSFLFLGSFFCLSECYCVYLSQGPPVWKHPRDRYKLVNQGMLPPVWTRPWVQELLAESHQAAMTRIRTRSFLATLSGWRVCFNSPCVWETSDCREINRWEEKRMKIWCWQHSQLVKSSDSIKLQDGIGQNS